MSNKKELERTNYANYKADNTIQIDKYISEREGFLMSLLTRSLQGEKTLLLAQTGSGKTYSIINILKKVDALGEVKSIFIVPNSINVEQIKLEYNIPGAYGDLPVMAELEKGNVVVMTWDKFAQIDKDKLKEYIVIVDEVHQMYIDMFRMSKINKVYENLKIVKGQIDITATPNKINFDEYSYILEYKQNIQTNYNVKLYNTVNDSTINNIIKNSNKFALLKDDTKYLDFIKENTVNKSIEVITSNTRAFSNTYKEIVSNSTMTQVDGICNTSVLIAGLNINEPNITDIIIIGEKDLATIKQYVARFRGLDTVNVHIFNQFNEEESKIYEIEWLAETRFNEVSEDIEYFNKKNNNSTFVEQVLDLSPIRLNTSQQFYWSKEHSKYIVNKIGIRNACFTNYYKKADIESFKVLLQEYFGNVEIVKIGESNNNARKVYNQIANEDKEQILEMLSEEKNILVGAVEVLSGKISKSTENYLIQNGFIIDDLKRELEEKNIHNYIKANNIAKIINIYTKDVIERGYNYNLAWCMANKGNRARGKVFNQINNIVFREIESKYPNLIRYEKIEDKIYNFIVKNFIPGKSYTKEHLEQFCKAIEMTIPGVKITFKELGSKINEIYNIENSRTKNSSKLHQVDFLYKNIDSSTSCNNKQVKINTVKSFVTLNDIIEQNNLDHLSLKVLKNLISCRIKEIEKEAIEINNIDDIFKSC